MIDDMTQYQTEFALKLGIILGLAFCLIYIPLSHFLRNKALKNIKEKLEPDESIIIEAKFRLILDFILPFFTGGFLGEYIIPFIIFPEVQRIDTIDRQYLPLCILAELICLFLAFFICNWKIIITNKRIINAWGTKFLYKLKGIFFNTEYLFYTDIKTYEYKYLIWYKALYLIMSNNKKFRIADYTNSKEINSYVEKQLIKNNIIGGN